MDSKGIELIDQEIRALERKWDEVQCNPSRDVLDLMLADEYVAINQKGIYTKAEVMESFWSNISIKFEHYRSEIDRILVHGDVAIVIGLANFSGRIKRTKFNNHALYSRIYVKSGGQWRISISHITLAES